MQKRVISPTRLRLVIFATSAVLTFVTPSLIRADPPGDSARPDSSDGLKTKQELRKQRQQEYVREHSDPSGKVHPDAYVKGIEHARHMKVAPSIGAKPIGESSPASTK